MPIPLGILAVAGAGAGGGGAFDLLETTLISTNTASVTFSNLNNYSDYKHLQLRIAARISQTSSADFLYLRFNGDSGANYAYHLLEGTGSSVGSSGQSSETQVPLARVAVNYSTDNANIFSASVSEILDFSNSSKNTTVRSLSGVSSAFPKIALSSMLWNSTAAVTSFEVYRPSFNLLAGSRFSLYGIK